MIRVDSITCARLYTTGFDASVDPSDRMMLNISTGIFVEEIHTKIQPGNVLKIEEIVHDFPAFQFLVQPDNLVPVVYDVYLLDNPYTGIDALVVERTEIGPNTVPHYQGDAPLLHCLTSFTVAPDTVDLDTVDIAIRTVVKGG